MATVLALLAASCAAEGGSSTTEGVSDPAETTVTTDGDTGTTAPDTTMSTNAGDWEPEYEGEVLQPLPDGFPDQPIRILVADGPASADGQLATQLAETASGHAPVDIRVEFREDFVALGDWEAARYIADQEEGRDGYLLQTMAGIGTYADLALQPEGILGLTFDDVQPVAVVEDTRWWLAQCSEVPWEPTFEALIEQIQSNPGEVRYMGLGGVGGTDLGFYQLLNSAGGGEVDHIPTGGGEDKSLATAACEGDVTVSTSTTLNPHVQSGRVDLLAVMGDQRLEEYPDVPTAAELGIEGGGLVSTKQLTTTAQIPELHLAWLAELLQTVVDDSSYVDQRQQQPGVTVYFEGPDATKELNRETLDLTTTLIEEFDMAPEG